MIAISDPSPSIDGIPGSERMLERFLNPADIGGRYSALSFVGLVPASLLGIDLDSLLAAGAVAAAQLREPAPTANRAVALGVIIGALAGEGRDKLTLLVDEPIHGFAAETTAATVIYTAAHFGMPVSTTHVISSAIMGVGTSKGAHGVRWGVARSILIAWVVTIPASMAIGAGSWLVLDLLGLGT